MSDLTHLIEAAQQGDRKAAADLLPLVYGELRKLAAAKMAAESPGHTLNGTALVHEAYLRLVGPEDDRCWENRSHFFAAAAEAMRRILVDAARRKKRLRHGGELQRVAFPADGPAVQNSLEDIIAVNEALDKLAIEDSQAAELVKLHYFAGLTIEQAAGVLGVSVRKAYSVWAFARAWLYRAIEGGSPPET